MANLNERLNRLVIGFECRTSWEQMTGDGARRFCAECRRGVLDVAQMRPSEIRDHLQASRGALCVRLTRQGGRLVMADEPARSEPTAQCAPRSVPVITAGFVAACLTAGAGMALTGEPAAATSAIGSPAWHAEREPAPSHREASAGGAAFRGRVTVAGQPLGGVAIVVRNLLDGQERSAQTGTDGAFTVVRLGAGIYELEGTREGFAVGSQTVALQAGEQGSAELLAVPEGDTANVGVLGVVSPPLRRRYDRSELVIAAVVGASVVVSHDGEDDELAEVLTDLHVESLIKGTVSRGEVAYRHSEYEKPGEEPGQWRAEFAPGTRVVALLERSHADLGVRGKPVFDNVDGLGLKRLAGGERAVYLERLDALARLERQFARRGETNPADLMEWMVATAEEPSTRGEAAGDIQDALDALAGYAAQAGISTETAAERLATVLDGFHDDGGTLRNEPPPALLGAFLTAERRKRLTAALRATDTFGKGDLELFEIVRRWDQETASAWPLRQLRRPQPQTAADEQQLWLFYRLADDLGDDALRSLAQTAMNQASETDPAAVGSPAKLAALLQGLSRDFVAVLESKRPPRTN